MEVNNNKFISTRWPYLEAKISPDYKYLAHFKYEQKRLSISKANRHRIETDSFFFLPNDVTKGMIHKYVYIRIEENLDGTFVDPFLLPSSSNFDWAQKKLGWYEYELATEIAFAKVEEDGILQKLIQEGFIMPEGVLKRKAARVVGKNKAMMIVYGEDAALSGFGYDTWKDRKKLSEEQKKYISDFNQRALSVFEIIASD
jgi:hypothetical protein